eukprot:NODE_1003_length_2734_cov_0.527693.p1 type:complete len:478 gc:universal NODE_1003_length_2734_cov_0.527693:2525-1092(-)
MHLTAPESFNYILKKSDCCDNLKGHARCKANRITYIELRYLNLNGSINTTLLPDTLQYLSLENNNIKGNIPDLSGFTNLQNLYLSNNLFTGPIFGKLPNTLINLALDTNQLNGTIPNLIQLQMFSAADNEFDSVENELKGNTWTQLYLKNIGPSAYIEFNLRNNLIEKVVTTNSSVIRSCDVSLNNISVANLVNLTKCKSEIQKYSIPPSLGACKLVENMFQKMGIQSDFVRDAHCCESSRYIDCTGLNVTKIDINGWDILQTVDGFAFSIADIPSTLETLYIFGNYNQTAKIPDYIPGNVKYLSIEGPYIGGKLPIFSEGLETLIFKKANYNQTIPQLPSTLKVLQLVGCNMTGKLPTLLPNLQQLRIQGNFLTGPLPPFPASLNDVVLGDLANEGNYFNDKVILQKPTSLVLGNTSILEVQLQNTSLLTKCDLSFNPLLNSSYVANYSMCKKYYLSYLPDKLEFPTTDARSSYFY